MADGLSFRAAGRSVHKRRKRDRAQLCLPADAETRKRAAENTLLEIDPLASCTLGITPGQRRLGLQTFSVAGLLAIVEPGLFAGLAGALALSVFAMLILYRGVLIASGVLARVLMPMADASVQRSGRARTIWPTYTILVPVYREPNAVPGLVAALKGIDYPKRQLDIQILVEAADHETLNALEALSLRPHFRIVPVPKGDVQTKPRALNYGLSLARGQYVAIYDAEDQMHSGQIKAAVRAFHSDASGKLACVQAPLVPHNGAESWIARQFEQEYLLHFGLIVPGLAMLNLPVLLGGTSNHFRKDVLEKVGAWDPYNVTEDADLGLRLSAAGYRIGAISPPTFEEAPVRRPVWIGQRSRWIKGFIQTLGVFLRRPGQMISQMGVLNWLSAVLLLGGSVLSAIFHGPMAIWLLTCALTPGLTPPAEGVVLLASGFSLHLTGSLLSWPDMTLSRVFSALTAPVYWPLQSRSAFKAICELFKNPYFWDKTEHGVTEQTLDQKKLRS